MFIDKNLKYDRNLVKEGMNLRQFIFEPRKSSTKSTSNDKKDKKEKSEEND